MKIGVKGEVEVSIKESEMGKVREKGRKGDAKVKNKIEAEPK